jgi:hypothetical protein
MRDNATKKAAGNMLRYRAHEIIENTRETISDIVREKYYTRQYKLTGEAMKLSRPLNVPMTVLYLPQPDTLNTKGVEDMKGDDGITVTLRRVAYTPETTMIIFEAALRDKEENKFNAMDLVNPDNKKYYQSLALCDLDTGELFPQWYSDYYDEEKESSESGICFFPPTPSRHFALVHPEPPFPTGFFASFYIGRSRSNDTYVSWDIPEVVVK